MPRRKHPLAKCLDVVDKLMKHPHAIQLFNAPVDIQGLGLADYLEVVKTPMDLGTIRGRLQAGLSSEWVTCEYESPEQVLEDIKLVWDNCIAYNSRPDEAPFAQAAREMVTKMNQLWSQAGLGSDACAGVAQTGMNVTPEAEISRAFNSFDVAEVPVRALDRLMVYGEDGGIVQMWSLDCQHSTLGVQPGTTLAPPSAIFARGTLKAPDEAAEEDPGLQDIEVDIGPILDWSVSLSGGAAHVCIQTDAAWYRVLGPSPEYEPLFFLCQLFARLCQAALMALREVPNVDLDAFLVLLCRHLMSMYAKQSLLYHIQVCLPLLCKFLNAWANSHSPAAMGLPGGASGSEPAVVTAARRIISEIVAMHQNPMEIAKRMQHIANAVTGHNQLKHKMQGPFEPPLGGPTAVQAFATSPGFVHPTPDGQIDAMAMTTPPQPLNIGPLIASPGTDGASAGAGGAASGGKTISNSAAVAAGGESEKRRLHLESKRAYEADRRRRKAAEEEAQRAAAEKAASAARGPPPPLGGTWRTPTELLPALLSVWDFLGTFSDILWLPPIPLARLDAALSPNTEKPEPCDEASEFVLRDVHCALLRMLEGRAGKGAEVPVLPVLRSKRTNILPCVGDHHWQVRLAKLLEGRAYDAAVYAEPQAAEALDKMRMGDYLQLTLAHRFAILNLLINIALSGEMLRGEIGARVEDFNAIKNQERGLPVGGKSAAKRSSKKSSQGTAAAAATPAAATLNQHDTGPDGTNTQPRSNTGSRPPANSKRRSNGGAERDQHQDAAAAPVDDSETEDDPDAWGDGAREGGREPSSGKAASVSTMDADSQEAPDDQSDAEDEEEDSDEDERDEDDEAAEADAQAGADGIAQWWIWAYSSRTGLRRCLGTDTLGRRYWLMAGRAGAYQIIVESKPSQPHPETGTPVAAAADTLPPAVATAQPWGVYTGSDIFKLVAWLRAGSMVAEEPVRRVLEQAPVPLPAPETVIVPGKWQELPIPEEASELNDNLPDGYKGILAPTLPGALIQPFTLPREAPPPAAKVHRALHAAASSLKWWAHGHPDAEPAARRSLLALLDGMHGPSLQPEGAPGSVRTHGKGVMMGAGIDMEPLKRHAQALAAMLTDRHAMDTSWTQERHEQWLEALRNAQTPCEATMLVSVFTLNVHWNRAPVVMHRGSFHNFAATQHVPLHFPVPGDHVAVLRTGLMVHIQHIRDAVLRPRRWGRDGGGAAPARGTGTPGGSVSVGAASGEQVQMGVVSRRESMNELATSGEAVKSENKNASNSVVPRAAKQGSPRDRGHAEQNGRSRVDEDGDQIMKNQDNEALKPKPEPDAVNQKLKLNVSAPQQRDRSGEVEGGGRELQRAGSCALDSARGQHSGSGDGGSNAAGASLPPVPPPTPKQESWLQEINEVEEMAKTLNPVQLMTVAAVAYIPADIPEAVQRPPTAWLMLRHDGGSADLAREPFVLPIHADASLPDYVVPLEAYERGRSTRWQAGDRFRMQFGGRKGSWYRGTVVSTRGLTGDAQADPWEALAVKWEDGGSSAMPRVSPWEVELDPNSIEHKVAEQRIKLQKECRAARTSKRTVEGGIEGEPPTQRARSLASSTSLTAETTPFGGVAAPFTLAGEAAPGGGGATGRRGSAAGQRTPRAGAAGAGTQHINAAALPVFHPPKMERPSSEWYSHTIGQDILHQLPDGEAFRNMVVNFHQGRGNSRFKVPNFGGVEVDLSLLFNEILVRGGVYTITENRLWKEVVKALKLEGGGSVATTNVRQAYEKSLRCFELYMRSGAFARDLESDSLPPAGQAFSSRTQLIRIWENSGKAVPEFVTFQAYKVDANGEPVSATAAAVAAATAAAAPAAAATAGGAVNSADETAKRIAAAAAAIGAGPASAASAQAGSTTAAADKEPQKASAPKPELKMVPQGPEKIPPSHEAPKLVNRKIWRMWDGHGWFPGEVTQWDEKEKVHEVVFAKDTPQPVHERMNLLMPPVTISWRDPNRLVSATAAAIAQAALHQCTGSARSARTSGSGGAGTQTGATDGQQVQ